MVGTTDRDIDFSRLNALFAERILSEMGGEVARQVFEDLVKQGATKRDVLAYFRRAFPTWLATAERVSVVYEYLLSGDGELIVN